MTNPKRGEIWLIQLDPTRGQEIKKTRPGVVISSDIFTSIPMRIIVPVATWQAKFENRPFMIPIPITDENGLDSNSAGNVLSSSTKKNVIPRSPTSQRSRGSI